MTEDYVFPTPAQRTWRFAGGAITDIFLRSGRFLSRAWPWLVITIILAAAIALLPSSESRATGTFVLTFTIGALATLSIALGWHRELLLGEQIAGFRSIILGWRFWRFAGVSLLIILILALSTMPAVFAQALIIGTSQSEILVIGSLLLPLVVGVVVLARLLIALPQAAIDLEGGVITRAWSMTRGNTWRIALPLLFILVVTLLVSGLWELANFLATFGQFEPPAPIGIVLTTMHVLVYQINAALLAGFASRLFAATTDHPLPDSII
jgi:hypothetical protein